MTTRSAEVVRNTLETRITVGLTLEGSGQVQLDTGLPFLEHMLEQIARHGMMDIRVSCDGDLAVDAHHSMEDIGITLGQAMAKAVGDKRGLCRYGHAYVPLDESLSRVVLDFSGRPGLQFDTSAMAERVAHLETDLFYEFFQGFVNHAWLTLHIDILRGRNSHHMIETVFKAFGRALRMALTRDPALGDAVASTKGSL